MDELGELEEADEILCCSRKSDEAELAAWQEHKKTFSRGTQKGRRSCPKWNEI
ncbi:hypothetical protein KHA80_13455 [Anaerobacillus sp. HL2]|nr:hypothetical protein KHA80_13455 [Anaerobacillus sp. HL2]